MKMNPVVHFEMLVYETTFGWQTVQLGKEPAETAGRAAGFEVVLVIAILLAVYKTGRKRR